LAPLGIQPTYALQPLERCEERPGIHFEDAARYLLNAAGNAEAVHGFKAERLENQHVQRALDTSVFGSSIKFKNNVLPG
jgi:hypothetical protein